MMMIAPLGAFSDERNDQLKPVTLSAWTKPTPVFSKNSEKL
jgi:hypothetical protein